MSRKRSRLQEKAQATQEINQLIERLSDACSMPQSAPKEQWDSFLRISSLLEELVKKQGPSECPSPSQEEEQKHLQEFIDWLKGHGAFVDNVRIGAVDIGERGLIATKSQKYGDLVLTVPASVMMSVHSALRTPLGHLVRGDKLCREMPNVVLSLHLLNEKLNKESFWKPYIQTLPGKFTTPLYYSLDDMKLLQGTSALADAINCIRNVALQYSYLYRLLKGHHHLPVNVNTFAYSEYRWAVSAVMTRQNAVPLVGEPGMPRQRSLALVPFWDMANHRGGGVISTDYNDSEEHCVCYALWECSEGHQFRMYYGDRSSVEFLINSGFVPENNDHDRFKLKLGISKADPLCEKRLKVFERCELPVHWSGAFPLHRPIKNLPPETTLFLRVLCMDETELDDCAKHGQPGILRQSLMDSTTSSSAALDSRLWSFLKTRCSLLLRQYPSNDEDDDRLLNTDTLSPCARPVLLFRKSERQLLREVIEFASSKLSVATSTTHDS